jgi:NAD(P)-dependent dehydrogenase (short-subunit alcohol dehydrogenase family)
VVNVASAAHRRGRIRFDDVDLASRWSGWRAYAQSKLANVLFTRELARRLAGSGVVANAVHPGLVRTRWAYNGAGWMGALVRLGAPIMRSPGRGADTVVWAAAAPEAAERTGQYLVDRRARTPGQRARDDGAARRLWDLSLERTGLSGHQGR